MDPGLLLRAWVPLALESRKKEEGRKVRPRRGPLREKLKGTKRGRGKGTGGSRTERKAGLGGQGGAGRAYLCEFGWLREPERWQVCVRGGGI